LGVKARLEVVELDVADDKSILAARESVEREFGRLDGKSFFCCLEQKM
jgi:NAD(P)-dependent dehydrogenase (short-subunit alcohol dehydrogenase family)